jgi:uncharacterized Tic20 family protein
MKKIAFVLIYFCVILSIIFVSSIDQTSGFISLVKPEDRSCFEADVCHDISDYKRATQGNAYPYEHCICHGEIPNSSLVVEVKGPRKAVPGETLTFTMTIYGGPGVSYGYGVNASAGSLPKKYPFSPLESNVVEIEYTAPSNPQVVNITFVGLSAGGDQQAIPLTNKTAGDSWNLHKISVEVEEKVVDDKDGSSINYYFIVIIVVLVVLVIILMRSISKKKQKG